MGEKVMIAHGYKKMIDATEFGMPSMEHQCILGSNIALKVVAIAQIPWEKTKPSSNDLNLNLINETNHFMTWRPKGIKIKIRYLFM